MAVVLSFTLLPVPGVALFPAQSSEPSVQQERTPLPAALPNLVAVSVRLAPVDTVAVLLATVRNEGLDATAFQVAVTLLREEEGGVGRATADVEGLPAGQTRTVRLDWPPAVLGAVHLSLVVDSRDEILEQTETDNAVQGSDSVESPMDLLASPSLLYAWDGETVGPASLPSLAQMVQGKAPWPTDVFVHLPWLDAHRGAVGRETPFTLLQRPEGPYAQLPLSPGSLEVPLLHDAVVGNSPLHTMGEPGTVQLTERPMVITILERPGWTSTSMQGANANGTFPVVQHAPQDRLALSFEAADHSGQDVLYSIAWLHGMGIDSPRFEHADGTVINFTRTAAHYVVHAQHFSTLYTFNSGNEGFAKEGNQFWSEISWSSTAGNINVRGDRRDAADELFTRALDSPWSTATNFEVTSRWRATVQGNWQGAAPLFLSASGTTDVITQANTIYVRYESRDSHLSQAPHYLLRYRDSAGVLRINTDYAGAVDTTYQFQIKYDAATRVLSMSIKNSAGTTLASGSYTIGTTNGDGFTLGKFGVGTDGWGPSTEEPVIAAWVDDLFVDSSAAGTVTVRDDDNEQDTSYTFDYGDDVARKRLVLPADALNGATSAQLYIRARATGCGAAGNAHSLAVNSVFVLDYNPCSVWSSTAFEWKSLAVPLPNLSGGATNTFEVSEIAGDWTDRNLQFAMDSDRDHGRTDASSNGNDVAGELMWYLVIDKQTGGGGSTTILDEDFDDNVANGWTLSGLWHLSQVCETAPSWPMYLGYNQDSTCTYHTGAPTSGSAQVAINLAGTSTATLWFKHRFTVESYSLSPYDIMRVELSSDGGLTWSLLDQWDSTDPAVTSFTMASYSLSSYAGATRLLRFSFNSGDGASNAYLGWLLDDVLVTSSSSPPPPPSNNPPTACINTPTVNGLTVTVSSCSTDPDGDPLSFSWTWGDGSASSTANPASHTYSCPARTWTVGLAVSDGRGGTSSASRTATSLDNDSDSDGLGNCFEMGLGTNPSDPDTDNDFFTDGEEVQAHGTSPVDPDRDNDGALDGLDQDPFKDLTVFLHLQEYQVLDAVDVFGSDADVYAKLTIAGNTLTGVTDIRDRNHYSPDWLHFVNVADDARYQAIAIELWDRDSFTSDQLDVSGPGRGCEFTYDLRTGTWNGEDAPRDVDGYNHCSGNADGTTSLDDDDADVWVRLYQNDYDGDNFTYYYEYGQASFSPTTFDRYNDPDDDGLQNWQELRYALNPLQNQQHGFDLSLALTWAASDSYLAELKKGLSAASSHLWDVTDGYFALGRITIYNDRPDLAADIIVDVGDATNGDSPNWPTAVIGGNLVMPERLEGHGPEHPRWHRTLVHELAHAKLQIDDEYVGHNPATGEEIKEGRWQGHFKDDCTTSIMADSYNRNELDVAADGPAPGGCLDTHHWAHHVASDGRQQSAWETLFLLYRSIVDFDLDQNGVPDTTFNLQYAVDEGPHEKVGDVLMFG